jgi:diacylglycerol kinase family enzyme
VARFVRDARRRTIDVGEVNGRVFVNSAGVGIDGHVARRIAATSRMTGKTLGYFLGSLVGIATYRPQPMRVTVDGELHTGRFLTVVAANGTHFGSGMHVAPQASLDDGQLDVLLAGDLSPWASLVALGKLYRGTHVDGKMVVMKRARVVEIELERPLRAQLDGETTIALRYSIRVRPGALDVLTQ